MLIMPLFIAGDDYDELPAMLFDSTFFTEGDLTMIATLNGRVFVKTPTAAIIDVNGVGYEVLISRRTYDTLPETGESCFLFVQTVVREDAITLYGFNNKEEKEFFLLLVTVSGIGPKLALTILSGIGVHDLCEAISVRDLSRLTALSGVGKKTAQRLCMELGEKVGSFSGEDVIEVASKLSVDASENHLMADAASALVNLGYPQNIALQALQTVQRQMSKEGIDMPEKVEDLLRLALQSLAVK